MRSSSAATKAAAWGAGKALADLDPEVAVDGFQAIGIPAPQAAAFVAALDERMADCVLTLYRSATSERLAPWSAALGDAARRPGLAVHATDDTFTGDDRLTIGAAASAGAEVVTFEGLGHWWMLQDPALAARTLTDWFARHDG